MRKITTNQLPSRPNLREQKSLFDNHFFCFRNIAKIIVSGNCFVIISARMVVLKASSGSSGALS